MNDYLTFIILLFGLFCVSGNITMSGDLAGSPRVNVGLLALGTLLSSWIGTTGASMLMIRPVIKMNSWRKRKRHIIVFFIFLVSNIGGCLTPIGDPPQMCIRDRDESDALKIMNTLESSPRGVAKKAIKGMLGDQGTRAVKKFLGH